MTNDDVLRRHFQEIEPHELQRRLALGELTPEATTIAKQVLNDAGIAFETTRTATAAKAAEFSMEEKRARQMWNGLALKFIFFLVGIACWNAGRAVAVQLLGIKLGAIAVLVFVPAGYVLARRLLRPLFADSETSFQEKRSYIILAGFGAIMAAIATSFWMSGVGG
jgi:hypothetical protein